MAGGRAALFYDENLLLTPGLKYQDSCTPKLPLHRPGVVFSCWLEFCWNETYQALPGIPRYVGQYVNWYQNLPTEPTFTVHHTSQAYCVIILERCLSYLTYTTPRTWIYDRKLLLTNLCAQRIYQIARETKQCLCRSEYITRILRVLMSTFHEDTYLPVMYVPR